MKLIKYIVGVVLMAASQIGQAAVIQCGTVTSDLSYKVVIAAAEGPRDDNFPAEDRVVIRINKPCGNVYYGFVDNAKPEASLILQVALAAQTTGSAIQIAFNDSVPLIDNSGQTIGYQIAYLSQKSPY